MPSMPSRNSWRPGLAKKARSGRNRIHRGVPAAPGIAVGPARRIDDPLDQVEERSIPAARVAAEVARFRQALSRARFELEDLRKTTRRDLDEETARIFDVQLAVLRDPMAVERTEEAIRSECKNAEFLFRRHMVEMRDNLKALSDSYFSERAVDLVDVKQRVLRHLSGDHATVSHRKGILLGRELAPSEAVMLDPRKVLGIATDHGGITSHASIMARARGIPAVVGVSGLTEDVQDGEMIALDGFRGTVEVNPTAKSLEKLRDRQRAFSRLEKRHAKLVNLPAETGDGHRIQLSANMELPAELDYILSRGAEGIGLFRTEFFFMERRRAPTEDEQYRVYRDLLRKTGEGGVVIRALDVGGDKMASYLGMVKERNPFFGMRGIRYLAEHPVLFLAQLKAILRAGVHGKARILIPMVSSLAEFREVRKLTRRAMTSLKRGRHRFDPEPELGAMVEVPSAVMMADELAATADFLSVGSNDLTQYMLAIDRDNQLIQDLYQPLHPAVLRAMKQTVDAGRRHGKPVSICGEMAGDPLAVPILLGLGFDQLSVSPSLIPDVKQTIRSLNQKDCRELARRALDCDGPAEVEKLILDRMGSGFSDLLSLIRNSTRRPRSQPVRVTRVRSAGKGR